MASLKLDISGMDGLKKAIAEKQNDLIKGVDNEMNETVKEINAKQIIYNPIDTGRLKGGNKFDIAKPLNKLIENNIEYAPYIEFGTGGYVRVPKGLEDIAIQFKGKKGGKVNIRPQPFFYRAYFEEYPKLIQKIKKLLSK